MSQWIFKGTTGSTWWQCRLVVDLTSQSTANNTSTLKFTFQVCRTNYEHYGISDSGTTYSITTSDGGTGNLGFNCQIAAGTAGNGSWKNIGSPWSKTITHNSNGTKTISCSSSWTLPVASPKSASVGTSWIDLPTIPRASSVSGGTGNIGVAGTMINISRASSSFTHTLSYSFGSIGKTQIATGVGTSYSWTIPTSLYAQLPNSITGSGTIYCDTYSGSTLIGSSSCSFNTSVINSNPTVTASIYDNNSFTTALTGNNKVLVKGVSNAYVSISATAKNSATISSRSVSCGDGQKGSATTQTLSKVTSGNFTVGCVDSRGLTGSNSYTLTVLNYIDVGFKELTIERASSTSTSVKLKTMTGQFWNANFGSVANTLTITYQYALSTSNTWSSAVTLTPTKSGNSFSMSNVTLSGTFDLNSSYKFKFRIADKLNTYDHMRTITVGTPIMDIGKNNVKVNGSLFISEDVYVYGALKNNYSYEDGRGYYHFTNGVLVKTNIKKTSSTMFELYITGNSYGTQFPIDIKINGYTYNQDIINRSCYCAAYNVPIKVFFDSDGMVNFWFKQAANYTTFRFKLCTSTGTANPTYSVSDVVKPTTGITNEYEFSNIQGYSTKNSSSIVSRGSNSNGEYIRFCDGTQICMKEMQFTNSITGTWGYINGSGYIDMGNWPVEFLSGTKVHIIPTVANTGSGSSSAFCGAVQAATQTSCGKLELYRGVPIAAPINLYAKLIAIGRWK